VKNLSSARPTPSGTRDVLPDEMTELRQMTRAMLDLVLADGYGEVRTPTLEYETTSATALGPKPAYRLIDEHGDGLVLRSDMTVPIARIASSRFADADGPLRFSYLAPTRRRVKAHRAEATEVLQFGVELVGASEQDPAVEILSLLGRVLEAAGLKDWRISVGHAGISQELLDLVSLDEETKAACLGALQSGDLVTLRKLLAPQSAELLGLPAQEALTLRQPAASVPESYAADGTPAISSLLNLIGKLPRNFQERTIVDFSLRPEMDYYGGILFEVYDPAIGRALGSGGRYDSLFDISRPGTVAIGFGLDVERVHEAVAGEERGEGLTT